MSHFHFSLDWSTKITKTEIKNKNYTHLKKDKSKMTKTLITKLYKLKILNIYKNYNCISMILK